MDKNDKLPTRVRLHNVYFGPGDKSNPMLADFDEDAYLERVYDLVNDEVGERPEGFMVETIFPRFASDGGAIMDLAVQDLVWSPYYKESIPAKQ